MRASERPGYYGRILDPPPPPPSVLAAARAPGALTALEADERERRRATTPAPKARRRGPIGRRDELPFHDEQAHE
jgi:hypothetical protein